MAIGNRLFALSDREYRKTRATPTEAKFRGVKLNASKYDEGWDRKRGAAVRMMSIIPREDSEMLLKRVSSNGNSAKTYIDAVSWFRREAEYLRRMAGMLDKAADRLGAVLDAHATARDTGSAMT